MIKQLKITNFESHKSTTLDFPTGLTVFVGESDRGKSGTFRAFNWVRTNKPSGTVMLPLFWEGKTEVKVSFCEGSCVIRKRGKSINHYKINDEEDINAGAGDPPVEVFELFNMGPTNYQSQIDRAFLMFDSSGERGRILNKQTGLDKIDTSLKAANGDCIELERKQRNEKQLILDLEERLELYEGIEEAENLIEQAEMLGRLLENKKRIVSNVQALNRKIQRSKKECKRYQGIEKLSEIFEEIKKSNRQLSEKTEVLKAISRLYFRIIKLEAFTEYDSEVKRILKLINRAKSKQTKLATERERVGTCSVLLKEINRTEQRISTLQLKIDKIKKRIPKVCPECGSILKGMKNEKS